MTLKEIKDAVLAGKRVCWLEKNYEVIHDSVGQWLIRCVDNDSCIGLTWRDGVTMNGKPKEFFVDVKPVSEILRDAASALRGNGHDCVTTPLFWDCECDENFRKDGCLEECPVCGASRGDQPDSRLCEVLEQLAEAYDASPLDGVVD